MPNIKANQNRQVKEYFHNQENRYCQTSYRRIFSYEYLTEDNQYVRLRIRNLYLRKIEPDRINQ